MSKVKDFLFWLLRGSIFDRGQFKKKLKPLDIGIVEVSFDMNLNINVVHPTRRTDGRLAPIDEVASFTCEIGIRDEDRFYSHLNPTQPDIAVNGEAAHQLSQEEIDNGEWFVRVRWTDSRGQPSAAVVKSIVIGQGVSPLDVGSVTLTATP